MKKIKLTQNKYALVDDEDFDFLNQFNWCYLNTGYAVRMIGGRKNRKVVLMHRIVNNTPEGLDTDHINRNRLDNRRNNLRTTTRSKNLINTGLRKNNKSGYSGVHRNLRDKLWIAQLRFKNVVYHLGSFKDLQEAICVRQKAELKYFL